MEKTSIRSPEGMFKKMRQHPYLLTVILSVFLLQFSLADRGQITAESCRYLGVVLSAIAVAAVFYFKLGKSTIEKIILSVTLVLCISSALLIINYVDNKALAIPIIALVVAVGSVIFLKLNYDVDDAKIVMVLILLGIAIRFTYVLYTVVQERQHDVGDFSITTGHAGYINYWYNNNFKLPDFDVSKWWQYYHPPLHHWLMAGLLSILTALDIEFYTAGEATQILPLLYSCLTMIVCYKVFRMVKLKGLPLIMATAIVCFHPTFIIYAGSFNNDMLLMLFMMGAIMWGLRWYRQPVFKNIIPLALCIGLGMMTKLSGWMVAPAVAFLFLVVLIKNIKKPWMLLLQFAIFGLICVPLGLWWQVRNLILFDIPLTFVPDLGAASGMYSGDLPLSERLFSLGNDQVSYLSYIYGSITFVGAPFNEINPTLGLFKTAMFDECAKAINDTNFPQIAHTAPILFWISVILFLICFGCFVYSMIRKSGNVNGIERIYFALLFAVILGSYYMFSIKYPQACTFNIRYVMPLIPLCALGMALVTQWMTERKKPAFVWSARGLWTLSGAFCAMSYLLFTQLAYLPAAA